MEFDAPLKPVIHGSLTGIAKDFERKTKLWPGFKRHAPPTGVMRSDLQLFPADLKIRTEF